ncbi:MAG: FAD-dependent thymidylate synthase [Thermoguttaceae bacterium]|nr:FAD-dependent thymidylate synthase [Thermoguttaceae bacterium]MBQ9800139.1 FAD-dependent thymidylate synthase [Thermoguttaceae bacterium]
MLKIRELRENEIPPIPSNVAEAERLRRLEFSVLDAGYVRFVDLMGDDGAIVDAARISRAATDRLGEEEAGVFLDALARRGHWSPFEMVELKFRVRAPIYVLRQWLRHRTASAQETSGRYVDSDLAFQSACNEWRGVDGKPLPPEVCDKLGELEYDACAALETVYTERLRRGVVREQARKELPLSTYSEAYWKIDLRNLFNFLRLRTDDSAQYEIRRYAKTIGEQIVKPLFPSAYAAFEEHDLYAVRLSRSEAGLLRGMNLANETRLLEAEKQLGIDGARRFFGKLSKQRVEI